LPQLNTAIRHYNVKLSPHKSGVINKCEKP